MIKHDGILIVVGDVLDNHLEANEEKLIKLHPSYEP